MNTERALRLDWIEVLLLLVPDLARQAQQKLDKELTGVTETKKRCQIYENSIAYWMTILSDQTPHHRRYERQV